MESSEERKYRASLQRKLERNYRELTSIMRKILTGTRGADFAAEVERACREEYLSLLPSLPFIGGKANSLSWNLEFCPLALAVYRTLKARGFSIEEIGGLILRATEDWLDMVPGFVMRIAGKIRMGAKARKRMQAGAAESRQRRYEGDWVYEFVVGVPGQFDFGVDYHECGILKYLRSQDAAELVPYLCKFDYAMDNRMRLGLSRTGTLADGAPKCDFRFKRPVKSRP